MHWSRNSWLPRNQVTSSGLLSSRRSGVGENSPVSTTPPAGPLELGHRRFGSTSQVPVGQELSPHPFDLGQG